MRPSVLTYDVTFLRHMTSKKMKKIEKNVFLQIVKVKGKTRGQGQIKVKGRGHLEIFTILYVIVVITWIYEKWKSASNIVNFHPILLKIDTHIAWDLSDVPNKKLHWSEKLNIRFHGNEYPHYKA